MAKRNHLSRWAQALLAPIVIVAVIALVVSDILIGIPTSVPAKTGTVSPGTPPEWTEPGCTPMPNGILVCHPEADEQQNQ